MDQETDIGGQGNDSRSERLASEKFMEDWLRQRLRNVSDSW